MDHHVPPSVPNDFESKLCVFPASLLCEHCHKIVSQHDDDSTNEDLNDRNLFSDLKQLDILMAHLSIKRADLNRKINRHHSPIIQKLPQDVLAVVFSFCLPDYTTPLSNFDRSAPLILGAVCKDWREIAWWSPRLWSAMVINISASKTIFESQMSLAREWLARSGRLPLFIRIVWELYDHNFHSAFVLFSSVVNNEISRWHTFHLSIPPKLYHYFGGPNFSAPILESLQFHSNEFQPHRTFKFHLRHCPRLREMDITNVSIHWIKVPMDRTTRICAKGLPTRECRGIIRRSPSLVHCALMDLEPNMPDGNPLSTDLKYLSVRVGSADGYAVFMGMTAPCLETFTFEMDDSLSEISVGNTLRSFLIRSGCSLHTFSLIRAQFPLDLMMNLLEAMPTLKNLTVSSSTFLHADTGETEVMLKVLARIIASQGTPTRQGFLVNLETLTFSGYPNFRPKKMPHINPTGSWIPYYTPERPLCSVTLEFYGFVEYLPPEAIPFLLALKEYGIALKVYGAGRILGDLLQPSINFHKSASQSKDWIENVDLSLLWDLKDDEQICMLDDRYMYDI